MGRCQWEHGGWLEGNESWIPAFTGRAAIQRSPFARARASPLSKPSLIEGEGIKGEGSPRSETFG